MNFKKRRIRQDIKKLQHTRETHTPIAPIAPETTPNSRPRSNNTNLFNIGTIIAGTILVLGLFWITMGIIKSLDFSSVVFTFGKELKKDTHHHTNFLLAGVGGAEHDGSNLTDTLIIASLDEKTHQVKMLSLPRDLYIDDKVTGGQRINKIYDTYLNKYESSSEAMEKLGDMMEKITGVQIDYTVKIDFDGFVKIVDALGGVDIDVENAIYDPYYPRGETDQYETFSLSAGLQHLDGETALKYARSRKTTSDFDRAIRQQQLISAIKEKALSLNILTDPGKIQALYNSFADSISTNLSVAEIIELAKIAKDIDRNSIQSQVLTDDFTSCGGLLYTPVREYFGGAAVLLPAGNAFDELHRFSDNFFNLNFDHQAEIQILNGTKTPGLALQYLNRFSRDCLNTVYYGNAPDRGMDQSVIRYIPAETPEDQQKLNNTLQIIKQTLDAPLIDIIPEEYLDSEKRANTRIVIELGADYKKITSPDPYDHLQYTTPVETEESDEATPTPERPLNTGTTNPASSTDTTSSTETPTTTNANPPSDTTTSSDTAADSENTPTTPAT